MPLVRVEVRNEYGLGLPELYKEADKEDPKAVLGGVAVAGLVGILRQLGDLAEFAAEVFHGLQEQVMSTSSRSHKLKARIQNIEAALPPIEKAILAQRNHLHFAYTTGSHWHLRIRSEQNHFIYSDLPRFIMDSYEECRSPPHLHLLDKFDTNGPGSCLKRYSDPTFFRTASAGSYDVNAEKISRNKKARRRKKKRTSRRNAEVHHGGPISNQDGRTQSTSQHFDGQTSPSLSVSTSDVGFKPTTGEQLNSFDSRTGLGYIDCVFSPKYTAQPEEHEPKEEPSSPQFTMHHKHTVNLSPPVNVESSTTDNDIHNSISQDQTGPSSCCITWDEKMEIMDRAGQKYDNDEGVELDTQEEGDVNFITVDHMDFQFENENMQTSVFVGNRSHPDDVESEPDNYMDALNTIESESETDLDCQTKREVEQISTLNNREPEEEQHELSHQSEIHPSDFELELIAADQLESNAISSVHEFHENSDIGNSSNQESVVSNEKSNGYKEPDSLIPESEKIETTPCEAQNSPVVPSSVHPIMIWTNGNLLGLEPSKPPDFTGLAKRKDDMGPRSNIEEGNGPTSKCSTSCHAYDQDDGISINRHAGKNNLDQASVSVQASEASMEDSNSSRMFEFGNRLLANGFRRQISLLEDNNIATSAKTNSPRKISSSPLISPSSSPPLSHMKISFQPSFDSSKLKLKLPNEGGGDMFPSFQLVPEPCVSLHEVGSDSDDDSFNRSSPYMSDDYCLSENSDSNSERWESGGTPKSKDHELYDSLYRISTTESVSSSMETGLTAINQSPFTEDGGEFSQSGHFDLPSYDSLRSSFKQGLLINSDVDLVFPKELTSPTPPLPPLEWRGVQPDPDVDTEKQDSLSETINYAFDSKTLASTISQQPKPAPFKHDDTVETISFVPKSKQQTDWQRLNEQKGSNQITNGKVTDEKEDFLHQIRAKSFNLRRTATARPAATGTDAPASVKVTAILEKANAIRQAVGSDDGDEDDNWSDT